MSKINAVITGVGGYVPEYVLTNHELSQMMDTTDEWITTRVGVKERRILKDKNLATSYLGVKAIEDLFSKTGTKPEEIDLLICGTSTPDRIFPSCASTIADKAGIKNAMAYDLQAACSGFIFGLSTAAAFIESGHYKKVLVIGAEKMSSIVDYEDRTTAPLFGDGAGVALVEPTTENVGVMDFIMRTNGAGGKHLQLKAGGSSMPASRQTVDEKLHKVYQEGQAVFKNAVSEMSEVSAEIMRKNSLKSEDINWLIPHQANLRIIDATVQRTGVSYDRVVINIEKYGNTSGASIPICLWDMEKSFKKGDNIILTAFGAGFNWGAIYLKWGY
jgi:3-oxoacyl-[acyl-carrier-protein] synthase-3